MYIVRMRTFTKLAEEEEAYKAWVVRPSPPVRLLSLTVIVECSAVGVEG